MMAHNLRVLPLMAFLVMVPVAFVLSSRGPVAAQPVDCGPTDRGTIVVGESVMGRMDDCNPG